MVTMCTVRSPPATVIGDRSWTHLADGTQYCDCETEHASSDGGIAFIEFRFFERTEAEVVAEESVLPLRIDRGGFRQLHSPQHLAQGRLTRRLARHSGEPECRHDRGQPPLLPR